ncbi:hypothetical protein GLOTRDRAFT_81649 [Gloeophyllum trabeum ATCC 11539]|uniref:Rad60/SUMO-like domain-containing protein n=1 Tax=Gloeophyllum trabeum (strain ATCC 11539 / FP-39264 / Madison 617) TaxID=670483 RepID=S7PUJ4_GLOTA|nr:uncharacterized protein GLOTRDRAFT_81649 [Gloeophyllum trabeum ATCC 11539]EPQ51043.1 hypothetical protein GLOTRDRAFT_81649 [Gloeophyllum trabeum ATCC 11539]
MRNRSVTGWKKIEEIVKEKERSSPALDDQSSGADTDGDVWEVNDSPRTKKKKRSQSNKPLPSWTRTKIVNLLSSDDDDDDEDALQSIDNVTPRRRAERQTQKRQKRQRSRSRSITPPPPLSLLQIQNARNLVRQALDIGPRPVSPTAFDDEGDSADTVTLDPELMAIAREVESQAKSFVKDASIDQELGGGPEVVTIRVRWQPHPEDDAGRSELWTFKMKRHDTFQRLFEETADEAGILVDNLIVTHSGKQVFSPSTPHISGIWAEAELVACEKTTYEYIRTHRLDIGAPGADKDDKWPPPTRSPSAGFGSDAESDSGVESESQAEDKFKLVLRSAVTDKITVTVRPTTTCAAIVKAFLKSAGLTEKYQGAKGKGRKKKTVSNMPTLVVDGDKMDPSSEIGEAGLEDGDCIDVVGL